MDIAANPNDKLLKPPTEQYEKLAKGSESVTEHIAIIREAFEKSDEHKKVFGDKYAPIILDGLLDFKEGSSTDTKYDLKKLANDQQYLSNSAIEVLKTKVIKK